MRSWVFGTEVSNWSDWASMAVISDGSYGVEKGLFFSFPVEVSISGEVSIVQDLELDAFSKACIKESALELKEERKAIKHLL